MTLKNRSLVLNDSIRTRITSNNRIELNKRCKELKITPSELLRNYARYIIAGGSPIHGTKINHIINNKKNIQPATKQARAMTKKEGVFLNE